MMLQNIIVALLAAAPGKASAGAPAPWKQTPSSRQLAWHQREFYGFIHFGPNTFTGEEWGTSQPLPDVFNPTGLDTDQWAKTARDAGMTGLILTAKHHDGMCLWNTSTTPYKIENSKWAKDRRARGLDANVVAEAAQSCKKHGIKFGIYLSPWDINRDPSMPKPHLKNTMYDVPQIFGDDSPGDYNAYYAQQMTELVDLNLPDGSKVELFEVWLDGASGSSTTQTFDFAHFTNIIREHQPNAAVWGDPGSDARWVGNEDGYTGTTNWHSMNVIAGDKKPTPAENELGVRDGLHWLPAESDARLRTGWFWHGNETAKSVEDLTAMYLKTQGRSINLLLDVGPDDRGLIPDSDTKALVDFRQARDRLLGKSVTPINATASAVRGGDEKTSGPANTIDGKLDTYWTMDDGQTTGSLVLNLGKARVSGFIVKEHIALGQRIGGYAWDVKVGGEWKEVGTGVSMGYKRIDMLDKPVLTSQVRLRITQSNAVPIVQDIRVLGTSCQRRRK